MRRFLLLILLVAFGCNHSNKNVAFNDDSIRQARIKDSLKKKKPHINYKRQDSIRLASMMHGILDYANKNKTKPAFKTQLKIWRFPYAAVAKLDFGHLFAKKKEHLIVRRMLWGTTLAVDIYLLDSGKFKPVCSQALQSNSYIGDMVKDVNGDHSKDFLVHTYSPSGCCLRDVYSVYLYQQQTGGFTTKYRFMNPTFSASQKAIRGFDYGQPGDVDLYKYKWDGLKVDTEEYITKVASLNKYHVYQHLHDRENLQSGKLIDKLPVEFRKIQDYDWVRGVY